MNDQVLLTGSFNSSLNAVMKDKEKVLVIRMVPMSWVET